MIGKLKEPSKQRSYSSLFIQHIADFPFIASKSFSKKKERHDYQFDSKIFFLGFYPICENPP